MKSGNARGMEIEMRSVSERERERLWDIYLLRVQRTFCGLRLRV